MMWKWWVEKSDVTIRRIRRCGGGSQPNILPPPFSSLLHNHCSTHCKQTQIQADHHYVCVAQVDKTSLTSRSLIVSHSLWILLSPQPLLRVRLWWSPTRVVYRWKKTNPSPFPLTQAFPLLYTKELQMMCNGFNGFRGIGVQPRPANLRLASQCRL